jgi:hypothetical protein
MHGLGETVTGLGDLNIFDLSPFLVKRARLELAVGPQLMGLNLQFLLPRK